MTPGEPLEMHAPPLCRLRPEDPPEAFPDPRLALREPDGLLAVGGDLSPARLLYAYRHGIFPWYDAELPILWWSPDPRAVILPHAEHVSRSLRRRMQRGGYELRFDTSFLQVMQGCAGTRANQPEGGTWINADMLAAYERLHALGHAHSVEMWLDGLLVGGLYGVSVGRVFFGESMFSRVTDASKVALVSLARHLWDWGYALLDCQVHSAHLATLGAASMPRPAFLAALDTLCAGSVSTSAWKPGA